jgi:hypothetical protein
MQFDEIEARQQRALGRLGKGLPQTRQIRAIGGIRRRPVGREGDRRRADRPSTSVAPGASALQNP